MIGASSRVAVDGRRGNHRPDVIAVPGQILAGKSGLRGEVLGRDALPMLLPAWEDLCGRSVEDNVYYAPRYARALLESVERDSNVRFAVVWDGTQLVALLPCTSPKLPIPLLRPAGRAWQSKFTFSCMPLLDRARKTEAAGTLLDVLASISPGGWIIPTVNIQGEACQAMIAALARRRLPWAFLNHFRRAALETGGTFDEHMTRRVPAGRRKSLARNWRRLEQLGKVGHEAHCVGAGLDQAVAAFLKIEASGWKGKRGTALACDEQSRTFAIDAFTGDERNSICRADVLTLDGTPIAVSLITLAGRTGFAVKACYDESYRSYGAGLLLEAEVIRSFLSGNWADRLDSATAGAHVLDSIWVAQIDVADLVFPLSPRCPQLRLSALKASLQLTSKIRAGIKQCLMRLKDS